MLTPETPIGVTFDERSGEIHLSIGDALLPITREQLKDLKLTILRADYKFWRHQLAQEFAPPLVAHRRFTDFTPL